MFRFALFAYMFVSVAMLVTSIVTGRHVSRLTGDEHYMLTRTSVFMEEKIPPKNSTDAALDAAFEEHEGSPSTLLVERPAFVLGLLDATGPFVVFGGLLMFIGWLYRRRARHILRLTAGPPS